MIWITRDIITRAENAGFLAGRRGQSMPNWIEVNEFVETQTSLRADALSTHQFTSIRAAMRDGWNEGK